MNKELKTKADIACEVIVEEIMKLPLDTTILIADAFIKYQVCCVQRIKDVYNEAYNKGFDDGQTALLSRQAADRDF